MVTVKTASASHYSIPQLVHWDEKVQKTVFVSPYGRSGTSPIRECDDSASGKKDDQEASYIPDYTGAFITEWEVPGEMHEPGINRSPDFDFVVDWKN